MFSHQSCAGGWGYLNEIVRSQKMIITVYEYIYPHCFAERNKAWGREKIENKANFKMGKLGLISLRIRGYEDFGCFAVKKTKPIYQMLA